MSRRSRMRRLVADHRAANAGLRRLWWRRQRAVAGRRAHAARLAALPLGELELEHRLADEGREWQAAQRAKLARR